MDRQKLADNISELLERVRLSAEKSQRCPDDILLLAVSKTRSSADIRAARERRDAILRYYERSPECELSLRYARQTA